MVQVAVVGEKSYQLIVILCVIYVASLSKFISFTI
jgi:hypothetical protein